MEIDDDSEESTDTPSSSSSEDPAPEEDDDGVSVDNSDLKSDMEVEKGDDKVPIV